MAEPDAAATAPGGYDDDNRQGRAGRQRDSKGSFCALRSLPNDGRFSFEKFNYKLSEALLER